jgi:uncharacterized protein (DUF302 family)
MSGRGADSGGLSFQEKLRISCEAVGRAMFGQAAAGGTPKLRRCVMILSKLTLIASVLLANLALAGGVHAENRDGIIRVKSAVSVTESVERIKKDVGGKGIKFFMEIDQQKLAADAGIKLNPSTLLVFGNPPLGTQFITANPNAGLDWPVRLLVTQDEKGDVWAVYTDFQWIANRHGIKDREAQFKMATSVVESITSTLKAK